MADAPKPTPPAAKPAAPAPQKPPAPPPLVSPYAKVLLEIWPDLAGKVRSPRERRVYADIPADLLPAFLDRACGPLGFDRLCAITGADEGTGAFSAIYSLGHPDGTLLSAKVRVPREAPVLPTVTERFPGAANYERELVDLLGFEIPGLPPGKRYPLPDDWPLDEKPLRKDWKPRPPAGAATAPSTSPAKPGGT